MAMYRRGLAKTLTNEIQAQGLALLAALNNLEGHVRYTLLLKKKKKVTFFNKRKNNPHMYT
jgi:hypothetical protein